MSGGSSWTIIPIISIFSLNLSYFRCEETSCCFIRKGNIYFHGGVLGRAFKNFLEKEKYHFNPNTDTVIVVKILKLYRYPKP